MRPFAVTAFRLNEGPFGSATACLLPYRVALEEALVLFGEYQPLFRIRSALQADVFRGSQVSHVRTTALKTSIGENWSACGLVRLGLVIPVGWGVVLALSLWQKN